VSTDLRYVLDEETPVAVMRLDGRLTNASAVEVRTALHMCLAAQPTGVVVDVSGLTAGDEVELSVFAAFARAAAAWPGCPVTLCGAEEDLLAALHRTAVTGSLPVYPDRRRAIAAVIEMPAPRRSRCRLPASPIATREAREIVATACAAWEVSHLTGAAGLIATELVSNAIRHAGGEMELTIAMRDRFLHICVRDGSPVAPERMTIDPETGEGGRGLLLVEALTSGWGSTATADGKVVWATLRR
jgi:anti-anti-sigma regulatory factor/anti-sigma regulatory factor (Ser/Thr protein kinase)